MLCTFCGAAAASLLAIAALRAHPRTRGIVHSSGGDKCTWDGGGRRRGCGRMGTQTELSFPGCICPRSCVQLS
jgi:hypothetical protein